MLSSVSAHDLRMRTLGVLGITALCLGTTALPARAGERGPTARDASVFALYCSGCHGLDARGVAAARPSASGPDLTHLALRSHPDEPLALAPFVAFVTSPRRPGAQRVCGERVFARLPASRFHAHVERAIVRSALAHVAAQQRAE
jgi:hypothetical protein